MDKEHEKWLKVAIDNVRLPDYASDLTKKLALKDYLLNVLEEEVSLAEIEEVQKEQK